MAKSKFVVTLDRTEKGRGCSWIKLSVEDTANSKSRTHKDAQGVPYENLDAFYGIEAVRLDDGRISVFKIYRCGGESIRRNSALRRDLEKSTKTFLENLPKES
jgi:hypothetical protein